MPAAFTLDSQVLILSVRMECGHRQPGHQVRGPGSQGLVEHRQDGTQMPLTDELSLALHQAVKTWSMPYTIQFQLELRYYTGPGSGIISLE